MQLFAAVRAGIPAENSLKQRNPEVLIKNATEETVDSVFCCSVKCSLNGFEEASGGFCCYSLFYSAKVLRLKRRAMTAVITHKYMLFFSPVVLFIRLGCFCCEFQSFGEIGHENVKYNRIRWHLATGAQSII